MPRLDWIGKKASELACRRTPICALEPKEPKQAGTPADGNLLIRGDNLFGLRALLPFHAGQVKLAYLDPPYNTGNQTWIYNDAMNAPETKAWLDKVVGPEDLSRSDKWLCMMQPRLEAVYDLLSDDGVVVCSIDDAEVHNLIYLLDQQFGRANQIGVIVWKTKNASNNASFISSVHEYIVVYAKTLSSLKNLDDQWRIERDGVSAVIRQATRLHNDDSLSLEEKSDHMSIFFSEQIKDRTEELISEGLSEDDAAKAAKKQWSNFENFKYYDERGLFRRGDLGAPGTGGTQFYQVLHPTTKKACAQPKNGWRLSEKTMASRVAQGLVWFGEDETTIPCAKNYMELGAEGVQTSIVDIPFKRFARHLPDMLGFDAFPYPKPVELLERLVILVTNPGDIVLDSFSGSGTTAHAVLKVNAENPTEDPRRFILVEMEEEIEETVTSVRIEKAIKGYKTPKGKKVPGLGGEFTRWVVGKELRQGDGALGEGVSQRAFAQVLAAYYDLPLVKKVDNKDGLIAEDDETCLYFLHGPSEKPLDDLLLEEIQKHLDGRRAIIYASKIRVDTDRARELGIDIESIPYDFPVASID